MLRKELFDYVEVKVCSMSSSGVKFRLWCMTEPTTVHSHFHRSPESWNQLLGQKYLPDVGSTHRKPGTWQ